MGDYVTKKELLLEIHRSKSSYGYFLDDKYEEYHTIAKYDDIGPELIATVVAEQAKPWGKRIGRTLAPEDVVVRVMTHEHVPLDPDRKRKARNTDQSYARTNFPPYKHFIFTNGAPKEVGRSHWNGGFENGHFDCDHGRINNKLAIFFMLMVERIAMRSNWRAYSYRTDMESEALVQLSANGLMFDESKSDNPFSFYTTVVNNAFIRVLNKERKERDKRDDLMEIAGVMPSNTRMIDHELRHLPPLPTLDKAKRRSR